MKELLVLGGMPLVMLALLFGQLWLYRAPIRRLRLFFCNRLGQHHAGKNKVFDGLSYVSVCPWCGKYVMQDGQGNWFAVDEPPFC
jgi:hypothetical protein